MIFSNEPPIDIIMSRQSTTIVDEELEGKIMVVNFFMQKKFRALGVVTPAKKMKY
jgi:hypothetical protein